MVTYSVLDPKHGARGAAFACERSSPLCFSALPALPPAPPLCKMLLCPSHSVLRGLQDQSRMPSPPGVSGWESTDPRNALLSGPPTPRSKRASYNLLARILTSRPLPHQPPPHVTNSTTTVSAPFVQGEGAVSLTSSSHYLCLLQEKEPLANP